MSGRFIHNRRAKKQDPVSIPKKDELGLMRSAFGNGDSGTEDQRKRLETLRNMFGVDTPVFMSTGTHLDPILAAHRDGMRCAYFQLIKYLKHEGETNDE